MLGASCIELVLRTLKRFFAISETTEREGIELVLRTLKLDNKRVNNKKLRYRISPKDFETFHSSATIQDEHCIELVLRTLKPTAKGFGHA